MFATNCFLDNVIWAPIWPYTKGKKKEKSFNAQLALEGLLLIKVTRGTLNNMKMNHTRVPIVHWQRIERSLLIVTRKFTQKNYHLVALFVSKSSSTNHHLHFTHGPTLEKDHINVTCVQRNLHKALICFHIKDVFTTIITIFSVRFATNHLTVSVIWKCTFDFIRLTEVLNVTFV